MAKQAKGSLTTKRLVPVILLLGFSFVVFLCEFVFNVSAGMFEAVDKWQHFQAGRLISAFIFLVFYAGLTARLFLWQGTRLLRLLLWLPALMVGVLVLSIGVSLLLALAKESLDISGLGQVELEDILWTLRGAFTMAPPVGIILVVTPVFIPMSTFRPKTLGRATEASGIQGVDAYVNASTGSAHVGEKPQVLLVEDDITCATVAMNFCRATRLTCRHVTTIEEARKMLTLHRKSLKLLLLDNFVGVGQDGSNITGGDWLVELDRKIPRAVRSFKVVIISGHPEFIGHAQERADLVLKKPWNPKDLILFMKENELLPSQGAPA